MLASLQASLWSFCPSIQSKWQHNCVNFNLFNLEIVLIRSWIVGNNVAIKATIIDVKILNLIIRNMKSARAWKRMTLSWTLTSARWPPRSLAISNPPYIPKNTYEKLSKEVKNFEPKIALLGGEDGLKHIREIIQNAPLYLKNNANNRKCFTFLRTILNYIEYLS